MEPTTTNKNNDCYFFYYSTCTKGDSCGFRHEASALGCEVMCSYWQQGNCLNEHCNFRHMELKKDRKSIPCYWENQRGGCKKPHCPFLHSLERSGTNETTINNPNKPTSELSSSKPVSQEWSNRQDDGKFDGSGTESDQGRGSSEAGSFIGSPAVDPLIVNFDEESDSEGVANPSPSKSQTTTRVPYCKTYEEIRLEEIQAESAAYYSYEPTDYLKNIGNGKNNKITSIRTARIAATTSVYSRDKTPQIVKSSSTTSTSSTSSRDLDFKILTLDEIKRRKNNQQDNESDDNVVQLIIKSRTNTKNSQDTKILFDDKNKNTEHIKSEIKNSLAVELRKRKILNRKRELDTDDNNEDKNCQDNKKCKTVNVTVPPVRLRRSPKRFVQLNREFVQSSMSSDKMTTTDKLVGTNDGDGVDDNETMRVQQSLRKTEIEVRLCDSSTSDDVSTLNQISMSKKLDKIDTKSPRICATDPIDDFKLDQFIDEHSNDDDDYLDTASDDILKDIDELLTEKTA